MTVKKQDNGKWMARISYKNSDGEYKQKSKYTFKTKKEALLWEQDTMKILDEDVALADKPFHEFYKIWFDTYKLQKVAPNTKRGYMNSYHKVKEYFKETPFSSITNMDYQRFLNHYGKDYTKKSVKLIHVHVRACVKDALHNGYIKKDFTYKVEISGKQSKSDKDKFLSEKETKQLISIIQNHQKPTQHHLMILVAISTGMRYGEVAGLTFDSLNYEEDIIDVSKAWSDLDKQVIPTKTRVRRTIKIENKIMRMLRKQVEEQMFSKYNKGKFVFADSKGAPPTNVNTNRILYELCKQAEIKQISFHCLRHTHASILIYNGMELTAIAKRLGHRSSSTTAEHYAHIIAEMQSKSDELSDQVVQDLFAK